MLHMVGLIFAIKKIKTWFLNQLFTWINPHLQQEMKFFIHDQSKALIMYKLVKNDAKKERFIFCPQNNNPRLSENSFLHVQKTTHLTLAGLLHTFPMCSFGSASEKVRSHFSSLFHISVNKKTLKRHLRINAFFHYSNSARSALICCLSDMSNCALHFFFNFFKHCRRYLFIFFLPGIIK